LTEGSWDLDRPGGISIETEVYSSLVIGNLKEWGEEEHNKGKSYKLSSLNHFTILGDARKSKLSKFSSFRSQEKVVHSKENILILDLQEL
jgi:hypothetical protein